MAKKKRYAQIGTGGRHAMFRDAVVKDFADRCEMVALSDINEGRLKFSINEVKKNTGKTSPGYLSKDFDKMIAETKPDVVIVTTKDCFHHEYVCRAMELGCDVITEKPMTVDDKKCQQIVDTKKKTGKKCTVTFNYRYSPPRTQIKDMLMSGVIGNVMSVDFHWMLDTRHGADYFRRWHRNKKNSGGLMVHKATHHFDLVNWWLSAVPETVYAAGHRLFYTPETGDRYGLKKRAERCAECPHISKCKFALDIKGNKSLKAFYYDNEKYDGYIRDQCVFSKNIDIEDSMNVVISYTNGAKLCYSLNAASPWEGYTIAFNGTKGRLEHKCQESVYVNADGSVPGMLKKEGTWTRVYPHWKPAYSVDLWEGKGGHGGGDPVMLATIFAPDTVAPDKYKRAADQRSGSYSILCGIAANKSMKTGKVVNISSLVKNIGEPDYPAMPTAADKLSFPKD
jgi:predicted dehydrogenase